MKPVQGSPVAVTMQESFGCAVENRFFQLQDDDCDPLDLLHQASAEIGKQKKKDALAAKKSANQKGNKKESQKERKTAVVASTPEIQGPKRAPKQPLPKVTQNENSGAEVKVDRTERRTAFREFRPNIIEKPMEYSMDDFEKDKQVRNWVANQRGGSRGRGRGAFPRNFENENQRGRREFERHSGSDRARVRAEDKRGGNGPHNWGSIKDACSEEEPLPVESAENAEPLETPEEQEAKVPEEGTEDFTKEMTLDEWKSMMDQSRPKTDFNLRKPESTVPSKAVVIHKSKYRNDMKDDEDYQYCCRRPVNDITSQLEINFGNLPRPGRGGRGGGRGRVRREEAFSHEIINVHDYAINPDDPDHFPALC